MDRLRLASSIRLAVLTLWLSGGLQASSFYTYKTQHFELTSDLPSQSGAGIAQELATFHALLESLGVTPTSNSAIPVRVLVSSKKALIRHVLRSVNGHSSTPQATTFSSSHGIYILVDANSSSPQAALRHEYVHAVLARWSLIIPPWLGEGLAEHFGSVKLENGVAIEVDISQLGGLHTQCRIETPLATLMAVSGKDAEYAVMSATQRRFYRSSALIVRYGLAASGIEVIRRLLRASDAGVDSVRDEVYREFGDLELVESAAIQRCHKRKNTRFRYPVPASQVPSPTAVSQRQVNMLIADLWLHSPDMAELGLAWYEANGTEREIIGARALFHSRRMANELAISSSNTWRDDAIDVADSVTANGSSEAESLKTADQLWQLSVSVPKGRSKARKK